MLCCFCFCPVSQRSIRYYWPDMQISYTWGLDAHWLISTYQLRACLQASLLVEIVCVLSSLVCNLYRLFVASLTAGLNIVPIMEISPWCLVKAREGTYPVTIVTSVPWEWERNIMEVAVLAARPAKQRSVSDSDVLVACITFYTASQLVSICMRFAYFATIGQSFGLAWANRTSGKVGREGVTITEISPWCLIPALREPRLR